MNSFKRLYLIVFAAIFLLIGFSCKKDKRLLGNEALPESDVLTANSAKNFPVYAHCVPYDSIISLNSDTKFLGVNNDGVTGKLEVGLCLNANLSVTNVDFGSSAELISANIILAVNSLNILGNKNSVLSFSVFALDSVLSPTRGYYTTNRRVVSSQLIGSAITSFTFVEGKTALVLPINKAYAESIMKNTAALTGHDAFKQVYKGFYIQAATTADEGVIYKCDLSDDISGFKLQYRSTPTSTTTLDFRFPFNGATAARYNTSRFTPSSALATQFNGDTAAGAQGIYLKGMGASKARVQIPFLKNYGDTFQVAINRAEVIFNLDPAFLQSINSNTTVVYRTPPLLSLLALDSLGREALTLDQRNSVYNSRYEGNYDSQNHRYVFNIPLHAQALLNGKKKNYGFALVLADPEPLLVAFRDLNVEGLKFQGSDGILKPVFQMDYIRLNDK
jgi:hypothetical protein